MYITSPKITIYIVKINLIFKIFCAEIKTDVKMHLLDPVHGARDFWQKQAWKLSAIEGEPNLSILWEVRQILQVWSSSRLEKSKIKQQLLISSIEKMHKYYYLYMTEAI